MSIDSSKTLDILKVASSMGPTKAAVFKVQSLLPTTQEDVDQVLDAAAGVNYRHTFMTVATAVLEAGFSMDASYLERASVWAEGEIQILLLGWRASGDPAGTLLKTGLSGTLSPKLAIACAMVAARLIKELNAPYAMEDCWNLVRRIFRETKPTQHIERVMLMGVVEYTQEPDLSRGMEKFAGKNKNRRMFKEKGIEWRTKVFEAMDKPLMDLVAEDYSVVGERGKTYRNPNPKTGRNDPCHCGSGKKYKRCCLRKDEERRRLGSDVAGKTLEEASMEREKLLTLERIKKGKVSELALADFAKVQPELREPLLQRFCEEGDVKAVAAFAEAVQWQDEYTQQMRHALSSAARTRNAGVVARLLAACGDHLSDKEGRFLPLVELQQAEDDPGKYLRLLKEFSADSVDDKENLAMLALGLLCSNMPELGVIVARIAVLSTDDKGLRRELVRDLVYARDQLSLPYADAVQELMERVFDDDHSSSTEEVAELQAQLSSLRSAERLMREELEEQKRKVRLASKRVAEAHESNVISFPIEAGSREADAARIKKLTRDLESMEGILLGTQEERAELRKKIETLENAHKSTAGVQVAFEELDEGENDWEAVIDPKDRPVRMPEYSNRFRRSLKKMPKRVIRAALKRIGGMAGGEAAAYVGEDQLEDNPAYRRVKVEKDYRILYRNDGDVLFIADLAHRSKLNQAVLKLRND